MAHASELLHLHAFVAIILCSQSRSHCTDAWTPCALGCVQTRCCLPVLEARMLVWVVPSAILGIARTQNTFSSDLVFCTWHQICQSCMCALMLAGHKTCPLCINWFCQHSHADAAPSLLGRVVIETGCMEPLRSARSPFAHNAQSAQHACCVRSHEAYLLSVSIFTISHMRFSSEPGVCAIPALCSISAIAIVEIVHIGYTSQQ